MIAPSISRTDENLRFCAGGGVGGWSGIEQRDAPSGNPYGNRAWPGVDGGRFTAAEAIAELLGAQIALRNNRRLQVASRARSTVTA